MSISPLLFGGLGEDPIVQQPTLGTNNILLGDRHVNDVFAFEYSPNGSGASTTYVYSVRPSYDSGYRHSWLAPNILGRNSAEYGTYLDNYLPCGLDSESRANTDFFRNLFRLATTTYKYFRVPSNCSTVTIKAWGGGGGSGGSYMTGTPGNGGSGGYAETVLTVGTHIPPNSLILCFIGLGGLGGPSARNGGYGGTGSGAWVVSTTHNFSDTFFNEINSANAILIAGGGGGGGACNYYPGNGGNGGSGGYPHAGGSYIVSANYTGATPTGHGKSGLTVPNSAYSVDLGGGYFNGYSTTLAIEAGLSSLWSRQFAKLHSTSFGTTYSTCGGGGGGAFQGSGGWRSFSTSYYIANGGGGGANKVYRGSGSVSTSNISYLPPNYSISGGYGYGGVGKGFTHETNSNSYTGVSGTPGRIEIRFS